MYCNCNGYNLPLLRDNAKTKNKIKITSPRELVENLREEILNERGECLGIVALDARNNVLWHGVIHIGTANYCIAHPRDVFVPALLSNAVGVIIIHNHPSGEVTPSEEDIKVAREMNRVAEILKIALLDFVIVSKDRYLSFSRNGLLNEEEKEENVKTKINPESLKPSLN